MNEISYFDIFSYCLLSFIIGVIYENYANKFDYNTGKRKEEYEN